MPEFPSNLPAPVWRDVNISAPIGAVIETQMDAGPPKRRRRTTARRAPVSLVVSPVTEAAFEAFEEWFAVDLGQGALSFTMAHPISDAVMTWRFVLDGAYSAVPVGENAIEISLSLELIR